MHQKPSTPDALSWCDVLEAEFEALYRVKGFHGDSAPRDPDERLSALHARIHQLGPSALCLSGGGIRSATFALGVLQGLAQAGVLGKFEYLSTVSGGGYIGGWFTAWLHREGRDGRDTVLRELNPTDADTRICSGEGSPVDRVRRTCRYLAPRGGVVSADVWTLVATMARNLLLNWLVILPLLAAALMLPRLYYATVFWVEQPMMPDPCVATARSPAWFFLVTLVGFVTCTVYVVLNFVGLGGRWSQGRFLLLFLAPAVLAAISITLFWSAYPCHISLRWSVMLSAVIPAAGWALLGLLARFWKRPSPADGSTLRVHVRLWTIVAAAVSGPILGAGAYWLGSYEYGFGAGEDLRELYAVFAIPIVFGFGLFNVALFVGLASSEMDDAALEWWSRCFAWMGIAAVAWMTAGVLVFYMADVVEAGIQAATALLRMDHAKVATIFAGVVPLASSLAGMAARGSNPDGRPSRLRVAIQGVALPVIIWGLLSSIAWGNLRALERIEYHGPEAHPPGVGLGESVILTGSLIVIGIVMSWFVPANRFSLHGMYRQRLIRTFLGSSRTDRRPNAFTGFDGKDDLRVHELRDVRPLHIINTTLNAVSSTHVGRHEHQAQSFTFSPLHVGNQEVGYRHAAEYGSDGGGLGTGVSLGMALAVSGAAASSALGIYSSKARAFLLTLANARLGLWFGNPQSDTTWRSSEPPLGIGPVARELLGLTTDHNPYVYLSDGGHYENLGLWEMVARRCRFIVVSDAGCDPNYTFGDLSNAVRRIRLDLGVPIEFPPLKLTREGQGHTNAHAAIGVIRYSVVDGPDAPNGTILYLKATLSGDEPVDVVNFAMMDPSFPHDTTSNQFFDEARFESYRALGFHTVLSVAPGFKGGGAGTLVEMARAQLENGT